MPSSADRSLWSIAGISLLVEGPGFPEGGSHVRLKQPFARIGRFPSMDLLLDHPDISRRHVYLHRTEKGIFIVDLGSRLGLTLGGKPLRNGWLKPNEPLGVGPFRLSVEAETGDDGTDLLEKIPLEQDDRLGVEVTLTNRRGATARYTLKRALTILGRGAASTLRLRSANLAGSHIAFYRDEVHLWVVNLAGDHAFRANHELVAEPLSDRDAFVVGELTVRIEFQPRAERDGSDVALTIGGDAVDLHGDSGALSSTDLGPESGEFRQAPFHDEVERIRARVAECRSQGSAIGDLGELQVELDRISADAQALEQLLTDLEASKGVRVRELEEACQTARGESEAARQENDALQAQLWTLRQEVSDANAQEAAIAEGLRELEQAGVATDAELQTVRRENERIRARLEALQAQADGAEKSSEEFARLLNQLIQIKRERAAEKESFEKQQSESNDRLVERSKEVDELRARLTEQTDLLAKGERETAGAKKGLDEQRRKLASARKKAEKAAREAAEKQATFAERTQRLSTEIEAKDQELQALRAQTEQMRGQLGELRTTQEEGIAGAEKFAERSDELERRNGELEEATLRSEEKIGRLRHELGEARDRLSAERSARQASVSRSRTVRHRLRIERDRASAEGTEMRERSEARQRAISLDREEIRSNLRSLEERFEGKCDEAARLLEEMETLGRQQASLGRRLDEERRERESERSAWEERLEAARSELAEARQAEAKAAAEAKRFWLQVAQATATQADLEARLEARRQADSKQPRREAGTIQAPAVDSTAMEADFSATAFESDATVSRTADLSASMAGDTILGTQAVDTDPPSRPAVPLGEAAATQRRVPGPSDAPVSKARTSRQMRDGPPSANDAPHLKVSERLLARSSKIAFRRAIGFWVLLAITAVGSFGAAIWFAWDTLDVLIDSALR